MLAADGLGVHLQVRGDCGDGVLDLEEVALHLDRVRVRVTKAKAKAKPKPKPKAKAKPSPKPKPKPRPKLKTTPPFQNSTRSIQAGVLRCLQAAPCGTVALGTSELEGPGRLRP